MPRGEDKNEPVRWADIKALHARIREVEARLQADVDKKKDEQICQAEMQNLRSEANRLDSKAAEAVAASQNHPCTQEGRLELLSSSVEQIGDNIDSINKTLTGRKAVKLGGIVALVLAIISGAVYVVRGSEKTDDVGRTVQKIETDVSQLKESHRRVEQSVKDMKAAQNREDSEVVDQLRKLTQAISEDKKKGKRRK